MKWDKLILDTALENNLIQSFQMFSCLDFNFGLDQFVMTIQNLNHRADDSQTEEEMRWVFTLSGKQGQR